MITRVRLEIIDEVDVVCTCNDYLTIIPTAYGQRAVCRGDRIRWTRLTGEDKWSAETYHGIEDDRDKA